MESGKTAVLPRRWKKMPGWWQVLLGVACVLTVISVAMVSLAMGSDHWVKYEVDRIQVQHDMAGDITIGDQVYTDKKYWNRHRGLYRICYSDEEFPSYFPEPGKSNGDLTCYPEEGYRFDSADSLTLIRGRENAKEKYETRNHLLRTVSAALGLSLLFNLVACIMAVIGACREVDNTSGYSSFLGFLGFVFAVAGMAMFHHVHNMETDLIKAEDFTAGWRLMHNHRYLFKHTTISFGYSYIMGWTAAALNLLACLFFLLSSYSKSNNRYVKPPVKGRFSYVPGPAGSTPNSKHGSSVAPSSVYSSKFSSVIYGSDVSEADQLYMDTGRRNQAYDLLDEENSIKKEDKPGQNEETKQAETTPKVKQARPASTVNQANLPKKESWYDKYQKANEEQPPSSRRQDDKTPLSPKHSDEHRAKASSQRKKNSNKPVLHSYGLNQKRYY